RYIGDWSSDVCSSDLILSEPICLKTGRDGGTGFNGLLIEARFLRALGEASAGADRYKDLRVTAVLSGHKPFERLESRRDHFLVMAAPTGQDERLREPCIRVARLFSNQRQVSERLRS